MSVNVLTVHRALLNFQVSSKMMRTTGRRRRRQWAIFTKHHGSLSQLLGQTVAKKEYTRLFQTGSKPELWKITISRYEKPYQSSPLGFQKPKNKIIGHSYAGLGYSKSNSYRHAWFISVNIRSSGHATLRSTHKTGGITQDGTLVKRKFF